jgi:hypothetical protein
MAVGMVMNIDAGYLCFEVRKFVEYGLLLAPSERVLPEIQEFLEIVRVRPCAPDTICRVSRHPGFSQSILKIGQELLI